MLGFRVLGFWVLGLGLLGLQSLSSVLLFVLGCLDFLNPRP